MQLFHKAAFSDLRKNNITDEQSLFDLQKEKYCK